MDAEEAFELAQEVKCMVKLTKKEERLLIYRLQDKSLIIGDICRELHTTPFTLLSKTFPNLERKLGIKNENIALSHAR